MDMYTKKPGSVQPVKALAAERGVGHPMAFVSLKRPGEATLYISSTVIYSEDNPS